jgi:hypothetical protein
VEGLGFDLLMVSDHIAVTPDVAEQYPAPFYEPFTTLAWLAGITSRVRLGTTVLVVPYRHPLLIARMAANLNQPRPAPALAPASPCDSPSHRSPTPGGSPARVTDADITAHPEQKLARWAARELDPSTAAATTMYTSCQPCTMCTGAIERSGLGRVVFALSTEHLTNLKPPAGLPRLRHEGPALFDEARIAVDGYYH